MQVQPPKQRKYNSLLKLIGLTTTCGLSAFYFGYCITYFNAIPYYEIAQIYSIESFPKRLTQGLITGSVQFTGAFGAIMSMYIANRLSCRQCLLLLSFISMILSVIVLIPNIWILALVRLSQGLVIGMISSITPWFISQMIPKSVAGPFWSYHQCLVIIGITASYVIASLCSFMPLALRWRVVFGFPAVTSAVQMLSFLFIFHYQSAKYLVSIHQEDKALKSLQFYYKQKYVQIIFRQIVQAVQYVQQQSWDSDDDYVQQLDPLEKSGTSLKNRLHRPKSLIQLQPMRFTRKISMVKQIDEEQTKKQVRGTTNRITNRVTNRATNRYTKKGSGAKQMNIQEEQVKQNRITALIPGRITGKDLQKIYQQTPQEIRASGIHYHHIGKLSHHRHSIKPAVIPSPLRRLQSMQISRQHLYHHHQHHDLNNRVAVLIAYYLAIQQPFLGGVCVINYPGDIVQGIFPQRRESFPILSNTIGIIGAFMSICLLNIIGRRKIIVYSTLLQAISLLLAAFFCYFYVDYSNPQHAPYNIRVFLICNFIFMRVLLAATFSPVLDIYLAQIIQGDPTVYCTFFAWISLAFVMSIFPVFSDLRDDENPVYGFLVFGIISLFSFFVNYRYVIETKSKSQAEIREMYDEKFPDKKVK